MWIGSFASDLEMDIQFWSTISRMAVSNAEIQFERETEKCINIREHLKNAISFGTSVNHYTFSIKYTIAQKM